MDVTRTPQAAAAKPALSVQPAEVDMRMGMTAPAEAVHKSSGYGLPCAKCRLYYPADMDTCPTCKGKERVSPTVIPAKPQPKAAAGAAPEASSVEKEREAFLKEFKSQLFAAHAEVTSSPAICALGEHPADHAEPASVCKPCYDKLQERIDVCEAALHIDVKEAAQIVYDAVWADPSDPSKTYTNAANALLTELRKRAGVAGMIGPFQPLGSQEN